MHIFVFFGFVSFFNTAVPIQYVDYFEHFYLAPVSLMLLKSALASSVSARTD